jgi:hypothetical protein
MADQCLFGLMVKTAPEAGYRGFCCNVSGFLQAAGYCVSNAVIPGFSGLVWPFETASMVPVP